MIDLRTGDCLEVMKTMADNSVDSVVCDPLLADVELPHDFKGIAVFRGTSGFPHVVGYVAALDMAVAVGRVEPRVSVPEGAIRLNQPVGVADTEVVEKPTKPELLLKFEALQTKNVGNLGLKFIERFPGAAFLDLPARQQRMSFACSRVAELLEIGLTYFHDGLRVVASAVHAVAFAAVRAASNLHPLSYQMLAHRLCAGSARLPQLAESSASKIARRGVIWQRHFLRVTLARPSTERGCNAPLLSEVLVFGKPAHEWLAAMGTNQANRFHLSIQKLSRAPV